ncbi:hypothetical protein [Accumulibacter sp.]|nr:hypothetical protein [Accumulibacter sp.]
MFPLPSQIALTGDSRNSRGIGEYEELVTEQFVGLTPLIAVSISA